MKTITSFSIGAALVLAASITMGAEPSQPAPTFGLGPQPEPVQPAPAPTFGLQQCTDLNRDGICDQTGVSLWTAPVRPLRSRQVTKTFVQGVYGLQTVASPQFITVEQEPVTKTVSKFELEPYTETVDVTVMKPVVEQREVTKYRQVEKLVEIQVPQPALRFQQVSSCGCPN